MILSSRQIYLIEECWASLYKVQPSVLKYGRVKREESCLSWGVLFVVCSLKSLVQTLLDGSLPPTPEIITSQNPVAVSFIPCSPRACPPHLQPLLPHLSEKLQVCFSQLPLGHVYPQKSSSPSHLKAKVISSSSLYQPCLWCSSLATAQIHGIGSATSSA